MQLDIKATDSEDDIRAKIAALLDPLDAKSRRQVLREIDAQLDAMICDHKGIGLPGCPTCGPRTRAAYKAMTGEDWDSA